ncbi:uncharacterized protein METZ01_LOCUS393521 [marine metagenome]|uniref:Uncharacterized protein n=1 Tax=marine metagenome TaxID=408172 RepID=A0A382V2L3_9ZZZZ
MQPLLAMIFDIFVYSDYAMVITTGEELICEEE